MVGSLDGQVALVTGGGKGIGEAIARCLAAAGATTIVADIRADLAEATARSITANGGHAVGFQVDVTSTDSQDLLFERIASEFERLDILVNNAGIFHVAPFLDFPLNDWRRVFAVNLDGALLATQRAGKLMQRQELHPVTRCRGKILNISSGAAERGRPFLAPYGASKAALNHLSKTSSMVLGEHDISTTVIYPTSVREGMFGDIANQMAHFEDTTPEAFETNRAAGSPTGRLQSPEEVGAIAVWVAAYKGMGLNGQLVQTEAHVGRLP